MTFPCGKMEGVGKIRGRQSRPLIFPTPSFMYSITHVIPTVGRNLLYGKTRKPVNP